MALALHSEFEELLEPLGVQAAEFFLAAALKATISQPIDIKEVCCKANIMPLRLTFLHCFGAEKTVRNVLIFGSKSFQSGV